MRDTKRLSSDEVDAVSLIKGGFTPRYVERMQGLSFATNQSILDLVNDDTAAKIKALARRWGLTREACHRRLEDQRTKEGKQ